MQVRDRVRELRRVRAGDLLPNPKNWRTHPPGQRDALKGLLAEVGYADALLARQTDAGLLLIDGHLRAETTPDSLVPVLVLDVTAEEADKLLATLDPLAALATADAGRLDALLRDVQTGSEAVGTMLTELAQQGGALPRRLPAEPANDPAAEWQGMPEFEHEDKTAFRSLTVHFPSAEAVAEFRGLIGQPFSDDARFIWHPRQEKESFMDRRY